ncbi:NAD(P) transhydrogenase subunit alpha [Gammaproteobacteria bacterium]|nr:NAD(P) transhydrogenase subunit alpha [Gammaproteobacteria bacterium]
MITSLFVFKESAEGENRVALDPTIAEKFSRMDLDVTVENDCGAKSYFNNESYNKVKVAALDFSKPALYLSVSPPSDSLIDKMQAGSILVGLLNPYMNKDLIKKLVAKKITAIAMELIPRITRAQSMDALSSQAGIVGYEGVLMAASLAPRFFPMLTTAAGTIRPAKVVVIGAGVAGLQAIATARRLGAQVEAYDIRPAAKEQVESLGAKLIDTGVNAAGEGGYARELTADEMAKQASVLKTHIAKAHAVISTAAIPGRKAPIIITADMVSEMIPGAVIIDLAAETGGNCELSKCGEIIRVGQVIISAPKNVASLAPIHASEMYAKNIFNLLSPFVKDGKLELDFEDEVIAKSLVTHDGNIIPESLK